MLTDFTVSCENRNYINAWSVADICKQILWVSHSLELTKFSLTIHAFYLIKNTLACPIPGTIVNKKQLERVVLLLADPIKLH